MSNLASVSGDLHLARGSARGAGLSSSIAALALMLLQEAVYPTVSLSDQFREVPADYFVSMTITDTFAVRNREWSLDQRQVEVALRYTQGRKSIYVQMSVPSDFLSGQILLSQSENGSMSLIPHTFDAQSINSKAKATTASQGETEHGRRFFEFSFETAFVDVLRMRRELIGVAIAKWPRWKASSEDMRWQSNNYRCAEGPRGVARCQGSYHGSVESLRSGGSD